MGQKPNVRLIGVALMTLLGTALFGVYVEGVEEGTTNGSQRPAVYKRLRYSTPEEVLGTTTVPSADNSTDFDSNSFPSQTDKILEESETFGLKIRQKSNVRFFPKASSRLRTKISATSSVSSVEEKDIHVTTLSLSSYPSTSNPSMNNNARSTSQWDSNAISSDGTTENSKETQEESVTETSAIEHTEGLTLGASSEVEHIASIPKDLEAQATAIRPHVQAEENTQITADAHTQTVGFAETEDSDASAEKVKVYAIPKEVRDIIALNSQLLGYDTDENQGAADLYGSRHHVRANEEDRSKTESSSAPPSETATRNRASRRRRPRKGQNSQSLNKEPLKNNEPHEGEEKVTKDALSSAEATERDGVTDSPLHQTTRYRNAMRRVRYTTRNPLGNSRRSETTTTTTPDPAQDEPNTERPSTRARFQSYRKRIPRYRVKVRRRNNDTLANDEENGKESGVNNFTTDPEDTTSSPTIILQEATEAFPDLDEVAFPVTTLRTQIIHAINELQQINTLIASRKDEMSGNVKGDGSSQSEVLQSRPLIQNSPGSNASHYEELIFRNPNLPQQEIIKVLKTLLNRPNTPDTELLPPKNFPEENDFSDASQDLQNFNNFTKWYGEDPFPAASSTGTNTTNILQENTYRQPKHYVQNSTQDAKHPAVYILSGIPVKALLERDLLTSKQQKQLPRNPYDALYHICQNGTLPEIIDCIRDIEQRKSADRKESYNEARSSQLKDFPKKNQNNDLKLRRSSRNSTAADVVSIANRRNEGNIRSNRNSVSAQFYSQPTQRAISANGIPRYNGNASPSPGRITVSPTPIWASAERAISTSGIPRYNVNVSPSIPSSKTVTPTPQWSSAERAVSASGIPRYNVNVSPFIPDRYTGSATANLGLATANLGSATANLGSATGNLGSATANLGSVTANLGSATPNLGSATALKDAAAKPNASSVVNHKVNHISSLSGAFKAGGQMLLSQLQKLRSAILRIPEHIGRLSADPGDHKQVRQSKSYSFPPPLSPLPTSRSLSTPSFSWR